MRMRIGMAIGLVTAAGLIARAVQTHHDRLERTLNRVRQGDLAESGAVKLRAAAELSSERLRVAVADASHHDDLPIP
jgi:hypothetical protein